MLSSFFVLIGFIFSFVIPNEAEARFYIRERHRLARFQTFANVFIPSFTHLASNNAFFGTGLDGNTINPFINSAIAPGFGGYNGFNGFNPAVNNLNLNGLQIIANGRINGIESGFARNQFGQVFELRPGSIFNGQFIVPVQQAVLQPVVVSPGGAIIGGQVVPVLHLNQGLATQFNLGNIPCFGVGCK